MRMDLFADFRPDIEALLQPIAGDLPAGPSMRYDPQYMAIRDAREEEDARLPMREWERPIKKADWRAVAENAASMLRSRSKDFQVAAWLCEAWIHQYQLAGFNAAVVLLTGLVERHWDTAHPQIEADDDEARAAPFFWINENLPLTLMLHVSLMRLPERMPSTVCAFDWDQALALENRKPETKKSAAANISPIPTRSEIVAGTHNDNLQILIGNRNLLGASATAWEAFSGALNAKMGMRAPSVAKVHETLLRIQRVCDTLIDGRAPVSAPPKPTPAPVEPLAAVSSVPVKVTSSDISEPTATSSRESDYAMGPINSREDAYHMLEAAAQYLLKTEPHSPTPYLIKRAVSWGRMSLVDLMQEIVREEGDIKRFFSLLGIKEPRA